MSLVQQIKRAAKDHNMYNGPIDDNWEPSDNVMFIRFCGAFGLHYTNPPSRSNQDAKLLDWLDNYKQEDYTDGKAFSSEIINPGGVNVKQFMPDKQPVNIKGPGDKDTPRPEIVKRQEAVNGNATVKIPEAMQPPKPGAMPDPKKVVAEEIKKDVEESNKKAVEDASKANELQNTETLRSDDKPEDQSSNNESAGSSDNTKESNESKSVPEVDATKQTSIPESGSNDEKTPPVATAAPAPRTSLLPRGKPAPTVVPTNTIKTR
jgi:hypothetical protein